MSRDIYAALRLLSVVLFVVGAIMFVHGLLFVLGMSYTWRGLGSPALYSGTEDETRITKEAVSRILVSGYLEIAKGFLILVTSAFVVLKTKWVLRWAYKQFDEGGPV